jgi:Fe-S oxidoreductase
MDGLGRAGAHAQPATFARVRIDFREEIGVDHLGCGDVQIVDPPEHTAAATAAVADKEMAILHIPCQMDETGLFGHVEHGIGFFLRDASARCCGGLFSRVYPEKIRPMMAENIQDAVDSEAEAVVFLCPLCNETLKEPAEAQGLKPIFITQLVRMALGELPFPSSR